MGNKKNFISSDALGVIGILIPIYVTLAPKEIRKEVFDYTIKFFGVIVLAIIAYLLYCILIKDKIEEKRRKEAIEAEETRLRLLREERERRKKESQD